MRSGLQGLRRLIGSAGSGRSSAFEKLAPYAAALLGNKQRNQVQETFKRNIGGLDTNWGDYEEDWTNSVGDLGSQRDSRLNTLRSGFAETEADLLQQKGNAAVRREQAGGDTYTQARQARQPYQTRINSLLDRIDQLGRFTPFTPKKATYEAPNLDQYAFERYGAPQRGRSTLANNVGPYWTLLNREDEEQRR
jgi:hypothetical protein